MKDPPNARTIAEFQERRDRTFRRSRPFLAMIVIGFAGAFLFNKRLDDIYLLGFFLSAFIGIAVWIIVVMEGYRCPECEQVVWDGDGVPLNPRECPRCGARLRK